MLLVLSHFIHNTPMIHWFGHGELSLNWKPRISDVQTSPGLKYNNIKLVQNWFRRGKVQKVVFLLNCSNDSLL